LAVFKGHDSRGNEKAKEGNEQMTNESLSIKKRLAVGQGKSIDSVYQQEQEIKGLADFIADSTQKNESSKVLAERIINELHYRNVNNIKLTAISDDVIVAVSPTSGEWHKYAKEHNKPLTDESSYYACWITKAVQAQLAHITGHINSLEVNDDHS
jgi:hypothetical protein